MSENGLKGIPLRPFFIALAALSVADVKAVRPGGDFFFHVFAPCAVVDGVSDQSSCGDEEQP